METKEQDNVDYNYVKLINKMKDFKFIVCLYARNESDMLTKIKHKYNILSSVEAQTDE